MRPQCLVVIKFTEITFAQVGTSCIIINHCNMAKQGAPVKSRIAPFPLTDLSDDLVNLELPCQFKAAEFISFPQTAKKYALRFYDEHRLALPLLRKLLNHGALGELEDAESVWRLFPDLLTARGTIFHPNRSYIDTEGRPLSQPIDIPFHQNPGRYKYVGRTFYQILLMNAEFEEAEEVGKLMSLEEKQTQFDEVFPDGEIKKYNFDLEEAKRLLQVLFAAVAKDESLKIVRDEDDNIKNIIMSDLTRKTLYKLYAYAKPKSEHDIGLVFDPEFYHEALKLYEEQSDSQFKQKWDRYPFWNICVEEWLAGCLGTRFLRPHAQGLSNALTRRGGVLEDGSSVFAFRRSSDSLPGSHIFVGYRAHANRSILFPAWAVVRSLRVVFFEHMSSNNKSRDKLYATIYSTSASSIMPDSLK